MCQKTNILKHFFVVLHHPFPLQKALVVSVIKESPQSKALFEATRNTTYLTAQQIQSLGIQPPQTPETYLVPIQIPRDWFIH